MNKLALDSFEVIKHIGSGNFSEVYLVECIATKMCYALKKMSKVALRRAQKQAEPFMEKHCLLKLASAAALSGDSAGQKYILKLFGTFQDKDFIYLVLEHCERGELWSVVSEFGLLDEKLALFYVTQLVLAVEHVCLNSVIHRDIKAENIFIVADGAIRLGDFGTAMDIACPDVEVAGNVSRGKNGKRFLHYVGSAQFMPPEAVHNEFSGFGFDLWSLGCTIYQIFGGNSPFYAPSDFLAFILAKNLIIEFPDHFPEVVADLVRQLLRIEPSERLGMNSISSNRGLEDIRAHPLFAGVNFANPENILGDRLSYPPLHDVCFQHMSKHWNLYRDKWVSCGWLSHDGLELINKDDQTEVSDLSCIISSQQCFNHEKLHMHWESHERPTNIEVKSRSLLELRCNKLSRRLQICKERVLYLKWLQDPNGKRKQSFWDKYVQQFLNEGKSSESSQDEIAR